MNKILILSNGKLLGPFPNQAVAQQYSENARLPANIEFYSIWQPAEGTADLAHECGARLMDIGEETTERSGRRAAAG